MYGVGGGGASKCMAGPSWTVTGGGPGEVEEDWERYLGGQILLALTMNMNVWGEMRLSSDSQIA